ncbi:MAG: protein arginine kinase [Tissierellaceae bacterium]|nr:protein arginine kinase [Tissierellaceae bacterium]
MTKWLDGIAIDEDVVISTRVRVARNISKYRFPSYMTVTESDDLTDDILNGMKEVMDDNYKFVRIRDITPREQMVYIEDHLISPNLADRKDKSSFLLRNDERATVMINEEDHIRIQTLFPGFNLNDAWKLCSDIDDKLSEKLEYAFDDRWGYLTACPTNVGTGLRASVMLHLPCITFAKTINSLIEGLREIGLTVRGLYGEGSESLGYLYQISNQVTLGESEEDIIGKLNKVVYQIIQRERKTREYLKEKKGMELENRIYRSYGILSYARIMSSKEAITHLSNLRLGWEMGLFSNEEIKDIFNLMVEVQPANIQKEFNKDMDNEERDIARAKKIRDYIYNLEG